MNDGEIIMELARIVRESLEEGMTWGEYLGELEELEPGTGIVVVVGDERYHVYPGEETLVAVSEDEYARGNGYRGLCEAKSHLMRIQEKVDIGSLGENDVVEIMFGSENGETWRESVLEMGTDGRLYVSGK